VEQGGRVRDHLRDGVEKALLQFGNGFLNHPRNSVLRARVQEKTLEPFEYYQQLLRLIYRFLFLMVSEERNLITDTMSYREHYSISRIRRLVEVRAAYTHQEDLWLGLATTFKLFQEEDLGPLLGVPILNGDLFDQARTSEINDASLTNHDLLTAMWDICMYREKENAPWRRINYAALDVEELGSVYESLLDFQPVFVQQNGKTEFRLLTGTERKSTGSYYTPPELVNELIQSALVPTMKDRLAGAKTGEEKATALLAMTVCDPACGSGHFLLAAARTIGRELAKARTGDEEPAPEQMRIAIRDAITHCIYGVDKNPLAVDLCKVALWLEGHTKAKPLTFLDHRIRCGDSLVGVFDLSVLKEGIPDNAFTAITGDDKAVARDLKKQNKKEREHRRLAEFDISMNLLTTSRQQVNAIADDKLDDIRKKKELFSAFQQEGTTWCKDKTACDLWTAAFFIGFKREYLQNRLFVTTDTIREYIALGVDADFPQVKYVRRIANEYRYFHWPLEFPEVFVKGGFDCVLGNPPWERIKLQQQEFFATRDISIANAPNKAARDQLISNLLKTNPPLLTEYIKELYRSEATSRFLRLSGRFPLTGTGDINTYAIFAEQTILLLNGKGQAGIILPSGIATDATTAPFFKFILLNHKIGSIISFENEEHIFPAVDHRFKFCIVNLCGFDLIHEKPDFIFFCRNLNDVKNLERHFSLNAEDLQLINPNTYNCPIFRTKKDAELTKSIYHRIPVLIKGNNRNEVNFWGIKISSMFHMANDSHLFKTHEQLHSMKFILQGNRFDNDTEQWLPLYEGKMFHQYDHRFGSYADFSSREKTNLTQTNLVSHKNSNYTVLPWYWINKKEVKKLENNKSFFFSIRNLTNATNERTVIASILPFVGIGHTASFFSTYTNIQLSLCLFSNFNSLIFDYITRQKLGGVSLGSFILKQLPVLSPETYTPYHISFIASRTIELTYTAWDLEPFAQDILQEIGAETWNHWFPQNPLITGRPQPFIWNEEWRAILRAELDALYAKLYGLNREELEYILSTFPVLQKNEEGKYGEYRTKKLVLTAWDEISNTVKGK